MDAFGFHLGDVDLRQNSRRSPASSRTVASSQAHERLRGQQ